MCNICHEETASQFVFPQENEDLQDWLDRLGEHDHLQLAMMFQPDDGLEEIARSYRLQGFTHLENRAHTHLDSRPFFNVLYLRDLVFITYGRLFATTMGWEVRADG